MTLNGSSHQTNGTTDPPGSSEGTDPGNTENSESGTAKAASSQTAEPRNSEAKAAIAAKAESRTANTASSGISEEEKKSVKTPLLGKELARNDSHNEGLAQGVGAPSTNREEKFDFKAAVSECKFWLLFFVFLAGVGSGVTVLNNLAQIGIAAGVDDPTVLLGLFSFFNFVGRLGGGYFSELCFRSRRIITRPVWMTFTQIIMIGTCILFSLGRKMTLYIAIVLLGICYGAQYSVMVPTVSELYGLNGFGIVYNCVLLGNPIGALFFSFLLAGFVYDGEAARQQQLHGSLNSYSCLGPECFGSTFKVLAGVCLVGTILSIFLTRIVKTKYEAIRNHQDPPRS